MTRRGLVLTALLLAAVALVVWTWPHDAVPRFTSPCPAHGCGGGDPNGLPKGPVFADSGTARFFRHIAPAYAFAYFALSPFGYLTWRGIRWAAEALHRRRRSSA